MTRIALPFALAAIALALSQPAAAAGLTRTFVSSAGSDANPCTIAQPCATFAHAYSVTASSGIIAALDPGKYGPLTITGPVTVNGNGWAAITAPAGGIGITVNAGSADMVTLTGLEVDGAGAGVNGIVANSFGNLLITNCTIQNFISGAGTSGNGILVQPTAGTAALSGQVALVISNTVATNNASAGIAYEPPSGYPYAVIGIDHVTATNNYYGLIVDISSAAGGGASGAMSNSVLSANAYTGVYANSGSATTLQLSIDNVSAVEGQYGIIAAGTNTSLLLGRSVITGHSQGIFNQTSNAFYTYQDNRINLNGIDINGALNTTFALR